jgi:Zn-dependent protease
MLFHLLTVSPLLYFQIVLILIGSIVTHELAHGLAAMQQGDDTPLREGHMTLNPLVHMGWESLVMVAVSGFGWGAMPVNPYKFRSGMWSDILVSLAGPLSNLGLGFLAMLGLSSALQNSGLSVQFCAWAAVMNFTLFMVNLIPFPPLDGFRVLKQFFPELGILETCEFRFFSLLLLFAGAPLAWELNQLAYRIVGAVGGVDFSSF